jgi:hypothetical protein
MPLAGYGHQLKESRYYLQVAIDRLRHPAIRDDPDVAPIVAALQAQHATIGELIAVSA